VLIRAACVLLASACLGAATGRLQDSPPDPVVLAAGDIADCTLIRGATATARLLDGLEGTVLALGDTAYKSGLPIEFANCYEPTWGRHRARTRPVIGNHEMRTRRGEPFYDYFGDAAGPRGKGYYSFDLGAWHVVALNSEMDTGAKGAQVAWLAQDLAAHPSDCILAYWHTPIFSSGPHGPDVRMVPAWKALLAARADVVLNGHDHTYERFAPQDENGRATPLGIREFVVGTGGGGVYKFETITANSEARGNTAYGVLKLTLRPGAYDWEFVPVAGQTFTDKGTAACSPRP
jgi:3',5'-cyclic AMP phosphodiesterase CpdA